MTPAEKQEALEKTLRANKAAAIRQSDATATREKNQAAAQRQKEIQQSKDYLIAQKEYEAALAEEKAQHEKDVADYNTAKAAHDEQVRKDLIKYNIDISKYESDDAAFEALEAKKQSEYDAALAAFDSASKQHTLDLQREQEEREENKIRKIQYEKELAEYNLAVEKENQRYEQELKMYNESIINSDFYQAELVKNQDNENLFAETEAEIFRLNGEAEAAEQRAEAIEKARIESEKKEAEAIGAVHEKYLPKIKSLKDEQKTALETLHTNYWTGPNAGRNGAQFRLDQDRIISFYSTKLRVLDQKFGKDLQVVRISMDSSIPQWAREKAIREFGDGTAHTKRTISGLANWFVISKNADNEAQRLSSITTARSDAVKFREQLQFTIREFEDKRDSGGFKNLAAFAVPVQQATKVKPKVYSSDYFKAGIFELIKPAAIIPGISPVKPQEITRIAPVIPQSIIGTNSVKSQQALEAFEIVQKQQQDHFQQVTYASNAIAALKIQNEATRNNALIGTANAFTKNGLITNTTGSLIEKKINPGSVLPKDLDISVKPVNPKFETVIVDSQNIPEYVTEYVTEKSYYVPGTFDHIFADPERRLEKSRRAEEIKIAGGTYNDYLKTIDQNSFENQLKTFGKGAKTGLNSYTSLIGAPLLSEAPRNRSLLDLAFDDIFNSFNKAIMEPNKSVLESVGVSVTSTPKGFKPFESTSKAFNQRPPAQNAGDIAMTGIVETGIALGTAGIGNVAIRSISKLPHILKAAPSITGKISEASFKETQVVITKNVRLGKENFKVYDFDAMKKQENLIKATKPNLFLDGMEITPKKPKRSFTSTKTGRWLAKNIPESPIHKDVFIDTAKETVAKSSHITSTKVGSWLAKNIPESPIHKDIFIDVAKESTRTKKPSHITNTKIGRLLAKNIPANPVHKDLFIDATKGTAKKAGTKPKDALSPLKSIESKIINNKVVKDLAQSKLFNSKTPDNGKPPRGESGQQYNKANNDSFPKLPAPGQTALDILKLEQKQILKNLKIIKKTKPTSKSNQTQKQSVNTSDAVVITSDVYLHPNRPQIKSPVGLDSAPKLDLATIAKIKSDMSEKLVQQSHEVLTEITTQKPDTRIGLDNATTKKQQSKIRYDLIVRQGLRSKEKNDQVFSTFSPPRLITTQRTKIPIPQKPRPPKLPARLKLPKIERKKQDKKSNRKGKRSVKYSVWNVDVDNIGTLPGDELVVSKSKKIFKDLDKRQTKASQKTKKSPKKSTRKKTTRKR